MDEKTIKRLWSKYKVFAEKADVASCKAYVLCLIKNGINPFTLGNARYSNFMEFVIDLNSAINFEGEVIESVDA